MKADDGEPRGTRWIRELLGLAAAVAIAVVTVATVAASARSELLFRDGDSLVTSLVVRSLDAGQPQDWAMSSVLFLPEILGVRVVSLLGLGVAGTLAVCAVVNLIALYGAFRVGSGSAARTRAPVAGAVLALAVFAVLAATEASPSRDALEPASLQLTTTYYSATVIGAVIAIGLARRGLERASRVTPWALAAVAAASVLTNPLFAAWATVPLALVLGVVALVASRAEERDPADEAPPRSGRPLPTSPPLVTKRRGRATGRTAAWLGLALVAGSLAGFLARIPLAGLIANTGAGYADPTQWFASLGYYSGLLADRWNSAGGPVALLLGLGLWAWCVAATVILWRRRRVGAAVVAACGWVVPLLVVCGAILLGTHAARYLQPAAFAPVLGLLVLPELMPASRRLAVWVPAAATAALLVAAGALGIPRIAAAASAPDPDLDCVVEWTDASARTGAGQFWTVRAAKAHVADPRTLVQVDNELRGYAWLVNRDDFGIGEVSFLVLDAQTVPFVLPGGASVEDAELIACGRYTIADFGARTLPLGPQRS